jgi:Tfp pilus assembly protein PilE
VSAAQERFYLQNNHYATTAEELTTRPPAGLGIGATEREFYDLSVEEGADGATTGYVVTATASAGGAQRDDDDCRVFTIDQSGLRGAQDAGGSESAEITARCWR